MNWYLMIKGIAMGVTLVILLLFTLTKTLIFNNHQVTMPVRFIVIFLCIVTLINGAQAF